MYSDDTQEKLLCLRSEPADFRLLAFYWGLFSILPLASVLLQGMRLFSSSKDLQLRVSSLIFSVSIYLGFINSTKLHESDLASYADLFESAGRVDILSYVLSLGRDPLYFLISYLGHYCFWGDFDLYIIFLTTLIYWFLLTSIRVVMQNENLSAQFTVFVLLLFAFLPDHFLWTAHIIRQMLALSISIYFITNFLFNNKFSIISAVCAVLVHSSVGVFILFAVLSRALATFVSGKRLVLILLPVLLTVYLNRTAIFAALIGNVLKTSSGERFGGDIADDTMIVAAEWLLPNLVLITIFIFALLFIISRHQSVKVKQFSVLYLLFFLFMLFAKESGSYTALIAYRYLIDIYVFIPLLLPLVLKEPFFLNICRLRPSDMYMSLVYLSITVIFIFRFFNTINNSNWQFMSTLGLVTNPILYSVFIVQ